MSSKVKEKDYDVLCRLIAAWVNGVPMEIKEVPDYEALFLAADRHQLTAAACVALEHAELMARCPGQTIMLFQGKKAQAIRKSVLMDAERKTLLDFFEKSGIWYLPLKGVVLNGFYPQYGIRQFADNDILFDAARWRETQDFMESLGYKVKSIGKGVHDAYYKPPIYNFELHRQLFTEEANPFSTVAAAYYGDVKERLVKDEGNNFGYHFRDEDFYIYFLAYSYKRWRGEGAGLRTVLDVYLYRRAKGGMDEAYIGGELEKLGLTGFETLFRSVGEKLFGPTSAQALAEKEREALIWLENSWVYGTLEHGVQNDLRRLQGGEGPIGGRARAKYLLKRVFPDREWYKTNAPFVYQHGWVKPIYWVYRLGRGMFVNGRQNLIALRVVCVPREGKSIFRLGTEKVKTLVSRPFQKPVSRWPLEKCAAFAMQSYERFENSTFDLDHPVLFTEKQVWYKLFYEHPDLVRIHDKYLFKGYIEEKLGSGYTAPLYGVWTDVRDLEQDWESLPNSFCLKSNCSFAGRNIMLIHDRESEDKKKLFQRVRSWLNPMNTGVNSTFRVYRTVIPRIIAEKLLSGERGVLNDYKVYCFDGKPYMISTVSDRFSTEEGGAFSYYDLAWKRLPVTKKGHSSVDVPPPHHLDEMLRLSTRLSEGFPFMRVDFYVSEDSVLVGELTPFSGNHFDQREFDLELGKKFILPGEKVQ